MRLAQTSMMIAALLSSMCALASTELREMSVTQINKQISTAQAQLSDTVAERRNYEDQVQQITAQLQSARQASESLQVERREALERMNRRYRELVDNPNVDITEAQRNYQSAVEEEHRNQQQLNELVSQLSNMRSNFERAQLREHSLQNQLATYDEHLQLARVERLLNEFNTTHSVRAEQQVTCERDETIGQCESRADMLAQQRASQTFLTSALENLTESSLAITNSETVAPQVRVRRSSPVDSGFLGGREFKLEVEIEVEGRMQRMEACALLDLDSRYCVDDIQAATEEAREYGKKPYDENTTYRILVRSNIFNDQVIIDGEVYGSTPIEVSLKRGEYDLRVSRRGYSTYANRIIVDGSASYWAELHRLAYDFAPGEMIQDALSSAGEGPTMVVLPSGSARLGNLQENAGAHTFELKVPVAMGVTPITNAQFRTFVQATGHLTSAEKGEGCHRMDSGAVSMERSLTWESPGYEITDDMPVTCVSQKDAQAYVAWLSRSTTQSYRLPSADEWEYAARGGTNTPYWWGSSIGVNKANCVTCGSPWANISPSPVGNFDKNQYGLADMIGNTWEWTFSADEKISIARGGAYNFAPAMARVHSQLVLFPEFSANYLGFRIIREESGS